MERSSVPSMRAKWTSIVIAMTLACLCVVLVTPVQAHAISIRQTDVTTASSGNVLLGVDGTFSSAGKAAVLEKVNAIRKEACNKAVPDPSNPSRKLSSSDYVPMKWSSDLERIAQTRAAEGAICQSHNRPNGDSCFGAYYNGTVTSEGENLAWNYSGMLDGISQWYSEMDDWVNQNSGAVTGHYTSLIDPNFTHIGLGTFAATQGGWACTAGEFLNESGYGAGQIDESEIGVTGSYRQLVEIPSSNISGLDVTGKDKITGVATKAYQAYVMAKLENVYGSYSEVQLAPVDAVSWKSSNPAVAQVSASGKVSSKACGTAKITVSCMGMSKSKKVTVVPAATKIKKLTAKKKAIKVKWAKQTSLTQGYQIRYSLKKSMKGAKTVTVKGAGKQSRKIKKLKAKKKYYVQIRTFAKVNGTYYCSSWSAKKAIKTK